MAKIGIVTHIVDHSRIQLALALQTQQHEVFFITDKLSPTESENETTPFQSLRYFQNWSIAEASYFFFKSLSSWPDILYFTFGESDTESANRGQVALAHLTKALPGKIVATSFFGKIRKRRLNSALIRASDVFTAATREDLMMSKRKGWISPFGESEVLPPIYPYFNTSEVETTNTEELEKLCKELTPYVFFPSPDLQLPLKEIHHSSHILIHGLRPSRHQFPWQAQRTKFSKPEWVFYTGFPTGQGSKKQLLENHYQLKMAIKNARWVVTAFQDISLSSLQRIHQIATKYQIPVIASPQQTELVPGLCIHQRNGWIVRTPEDLEKWLLKIDSSSTNTQQLSVDDSLLENPKFEMGNWNFGDTSLNELNRLFTKARSRKLLPSRGREWVRSNFHRK